jgi:hypothetical protein
MADGCAIMELFYSGGEKVRQQNDDLNTEHDPEWVNLSEHGWVSFD